MNAPLLGHDTAKIPPHSFPAEQAVLGTLMMKNKSFDDISDFLRAEHFADPTHGRIFSVIADMIGKGRRADAVTIKEKMADDQGLIDQGGDSYLVRLSGVAVHFPIVDYAKMIVDYFIRREMIAAGEDLVNLSFDTSSDQSASAIQEAHEARLLSLAQGMATTPGLRHFADFSQATVRQYEEAHRNKGNLAGISSGFSAIDKKLGGLRKSNLIILAGRPSMGKTALATEMGTKVAKRGIPVAFFSLEMSGEQLTSRVLSSHAKVSGFRAEQGLCTQEEMERMLDAHNELSEMPLYIDDTGARTVMSIRTEARRLKRKNGIGLIIIDYIGLAAPVNPSRTQNKVHEIGEITAGLKSIAMELNVPVLALCQLNRALEQRDDKRPQLSDLRDSGSIEQDADSVVFVYREQYYLERAEPSKRPDESEEKFSARHQHWSDRIAEVANKAEAIIAKNRLGPIGTAHLQFNGEFTSFNDLYIPPSGGRGDFYD